MPCLAHTLQLIVKSAYVTHSVVLRQFRRGFESIIQPTAEDFSPLPSASSSMSAESITCSSTYGAWSSCSAACSYKTHTRCSGVRMFAGLGGTRTSWWRPDRIISRPEPLLVFGIKNEGSGTQLLHRLLTVLIQQCDRARVMWQMLLRLVLSVHLSALSVRYFNKGAI